MTRSPVQQQAAPLHAKHWLCRAISDLTVLETRLSYRGRNRQRFLVFLQVDLFYEASLHLMNPKVSIKTLKERPLIRTH